MVRIGESLCVFALALTAPGCGGLASRPPTLDYQEASVLVEVRFDGEPFNVDFSLARDESERVRARCWQACKLHLPPGLYRIRAYGDGPSIEKVRLIRQHSRLLITRGSSELRSLGIGLEVSGALGLGILTVGALQSVSPNTEISRSRGPNLAIIGGGGAIALGLGILLHQGARSSFHLTEIEDEPQPLSSGSAPVLDASGVGFSF